jgi:cytochrome P450
MEMDFVLRPNQNLPVSAHERMRAAGPVVWSDSLNGWLVSSYEGVRTVLSDLARFTSKGTAVEETLGREAMLVDDTPLHHKVRAVWTKPVSKAVIVARANEFRATAARVIGEAKARLEAGETIDLLPVLREYVTEFIHSSFGVPYERLEVFQRWSLMSADAPALALDEGSERAELHHRVRAEVVDLVKLEAEERRQAFARGEEPTDLVALMTAAEGMHGITRPMVIDNLFNFILGSMDTTERWIGLVLIHLFRRPELYARLRDDRGLVERTVDEVMRVDTVAQVIMRCVKEDGVELYGRKMGKGDAVFLMLGAASRDPETFEAADRFDIDRPQKPLLGFGYGFHHCLGINTARQETMSFVNAVLDALPPLTVVESDFGNNWALWGPRTLMVRL